MKKMLIIAISLISLPLLAMDTTKRRRLFAPDPEPVVQVHMPAFPTEMPESTGPKKETLRLQLNGQRASINQYLGILTDGLPVKTAQFAFHLQVVANRLQEIRADLKTGDQTLKKLAFETSKRFESLTRKFVDLFSTAASALVEESEDYAGLTQAEQLLMRNTCNEYIRAYNVLVEFLNNDEDYQASLDEILAALTFLEESI